MGVATTPHQKKGTQNKEEMIMAKVKWTTARHMYYGGIVLAHESKLGNRYVSIENFGKDYKDVSMYEYRQVEREDDPTIKEWKWMLVWNTSFEKMAEAKAEGTKWLTGVA